jgi:hypothetical protein
MLRSLAIASAAVTNSLDISPAPSGRASGPAAGIAEGRRAVAVAGSGTGGPARAVAERPRAVRVGGDRASDPAAGVAERGLTLRGGENGARQ